MKSQNMCALLKFLRPLRLCVSAFFYLFAFALLTHAQPKTPADELASFHLADTNLVVELVAAEPDVISPVAMCWDADGRLFVAEMSDYPMGPAGGKIKLLEDRDGDGRYERVTVFADKLNFPNCVLPWNGGVLVTAAPDILFLKDTDGDGRADERHVLLTGFGEGNQQLRVNGLTWGLDNWIYGANGRSDGEVYPVEVLAGSDWAKVGTALARTNSIRGHDFRFRPGTGEFEAIAGRSQFGQTRDDWGNRFLSWNTMPIRHEVIPERYLKRNPHLDTSECVADLLPPDDTGQIFPLTPPPLVFNNESGSYFNALAGLTIFRGDALGEKYRGNAFMGEALRNLIHRRVLEPSGVTFIARRNDTNSEIGFSLEKFLKKADEGPEFLASTDPWFHPVNFATAPDGALYFADFYRQFVEHPNYVHGEGIKDKIAWRTGAEHGRIWRIRAKDRKFANAEPRLAKANANELIELLKSSNGWWADTAQRLLVERKTTSTTSDLRKLLLFTTNSLNRVRALWTLAGIGGLEKSQMQSAIISPDPILSEHGLRVAEPRLRNDAELRRTVINHLLRRPIEPARLRGEFILALGEFPEPERAELICRLRPTYTKSHWASLAVLSSARDQAWPLLYHSKALWNPLYDGASELDWLGGKLVEQIGVTQPKKDVAEFLNALVRPWSPRGHTDGAKVFFLAEFARGCDRSVKPFKELLDNPSGTWATRADDLRKIIETAAELVERNDFKLAPATGTHIFWRPDYKPQRMRQSPEEPTYRKVRLAAIYLLGSGNPAIGREQLLKLLQTDDATEIMSAGVDAIVRLNDPAFFERVFVDWEKYPKQTQHLLIFGGGRSEMLVSAFLNAAEQRKIHASTIDPVQRQVLSKQRNPEFKARIEKLFPTTLSNREGVLRDLQPALKLPGDTKRGAALFGKTCVTCHAVQGKGKNVGPDLSGIGAHPKETLLVDIFDPSRQVASDYVSQTIVTTSGETVSGIITTESGVRVTLRQAGGLDETFVRSQIKEITADGKSLMPDGLEQGMSQQDVADLLEFLAHPDAKLLPEP